MLRWIAISMFSTAPLFAQSPNPYEPPPAGPCMRISRTIRAYHATQKLQNIEAILKSKGIDIKDVQFPKIEGFPELTLINVNSLPEEVRADFKQIDEDVRSSVPKGLRRKVSEAAAFGLVVYGALNATYAMANYLYFNEHWVDNTIINLQNTGGTIFFGTALHLLGSSLFGDSDKISGLFFNQTTPGGNVYLMIEGEKTYQAYRRYLGNTFHSPSRSPREKSN